MMNDPQSILLPYKRIVSIINTPNPDYVRPEDGGIDDIIINPKNIIEWTEKKTFATP
jgi:hypothetical protein